MGIDMRSPAELAAFMTASAFANPKCKKIRRIPDQAVCQATAA
jgi:hypothetical protein